jgi:catechol 2,3-dioxygenase-like lactoylglutathione lyase family enzyme
VGIVDADRTDLVATVLGAPDPQRLADFYAQLLGWEFKYSAPDWVRLVAPGGGAALSFQLEENHVPPVWPAVKGGQQMMMHLDIYAPDLETEVARAIELGATLAEFQPQDDVRVMIDPAGHPFCLFAD